MHFVGFYNTFVSSLCKMKRNVSCTWSTAICVKFLFVLFPPPFHSPNFNHNSWNVRIVFISSVSPEGGGEGGLFFTTWAKCDVSPWPAKNIILRALFP